MAELSVYVNGATEAQVKAAVKAWADPIHYIDYYIEEASCYTGYTVAIDMYGPDDDELEQQALQLIEALPYQAITDMELDLRNGLK